MSSVERSFYRNLRNANVKMVCIEDSGTAMYFCYIKRHRCYRENILPSYYLLQSSFLSFFLSFFLPQVKTVYRKLTSEISALKNIWIMALNIPEEMEPYESTMTENYLKAKQQVELSSAPFAHGIANDICSTLISLMWVWSFRTSVL